MKCPNCRGTGAEPLSDNVNWLPCRTCAGTGEAPPTGDNYARRTDPATSHVAAAISSKRKGTADRLILEWLLANQHTGGTTLEISREIHRAHNNISPRFKRLEEAGLIHRTEEKRRDPTTKCESIVWRIGAPEPEQQALL